MMDYLSGHDMTCDAFADQLADYLEGDASDAVRAGVEAHAAACASCAALLADLQAIPVDAAALPALAPSRDLWAGIADRIDARVLPLDASRTTRAPGPVRRGWMRPAVAAAALVLVTAGVTNWLTRASMVAPRVAAGHDTAAPRAVDQVASVVLPAEDSSVSAGGPGSDAMVRRVASGSANDTRTGARGRVGAAVASPSPRRAPAGAPAGAVPARLASTGAATNPVDPVYDRDIATLREIVRGRSAQLDPATVAVLEQSVAVIDSAIAQSRAALARDPASRFLATQLNHSLEKKVELLRTAAMLPART